MHAPYWVCAYGACTFERIFVGPIQLVLRTFLHACPVLSLVCCYGSQQPARPRKRRDNGPKEQLLLSGDGVSAGHGLHCGPQRRDVQQDLVGLRGEHVAAGR